MRTIVSLREYNSRTSRDLNPPIKFDDLRKLPVSVDGITVTKPEFFQARP
jgi:hypothetical protein